MGLRLKKRFKWAVFNPLLISICVVMAFLSAFHIDYEVYDKSAKYISYLLTPATICLAVPLYRQLELLKKHSKAIIAGTLTGVLTTMSSVLLLALIFGLNHQEYVTFLPKSITTAIAMGISEEMRGYVTITVASIIITGIQGSIIAEAVCRVFKITEHCQGHCHWCCFPCRRDHKSHRNGRNRRSHEQPGHCNFRALYCFICFCFLEFLIRSKKSKTFFDILAKSMKLSV